MLLLIFFDPELRMALAETKMLTTKFAVILAA